MSWCLATRCGLPSREWVGCVTVQSNQLHWHLPSSISCGYFRTTVFLLGFIYMLSGKYCYVKLSKCKESYNLKKSEVSEMPQNCRWASLNEWKLVIVVYLPLLKSRHEKQLLVIGQTAQLLSCWCMKHRWSGYLAMFVTSFIVILKSTRITCWLCEWSPVSRTYWHWPAYFIQSAQITNSTARVLSQQWYNTLCFL